MSAVNDSKFKSYLEAISKDYKCWWNLYTLTDAEGKKNLEQKSSSLSSPFDFGLMVQSVQPKQQQENLEENQEKEKIERLPVLKGIRKYANNHVLLVGKPGSGKSTALARLLLEEAQAASSVNNKTIPVLVELRYWQSSIFERIEAFLQQHDANLNLDETTLKTLLRQGKFLLLIDGVNELPSEDAGRQVAIFRKDYPQTPMIFTTRDLGVGGDLGIEKKLEMQPLNETQMRDFVMAYLPQQGEELLQRLKDRLREFGKTPLLLWMLCGLFQQTGNIPANLGMVFRLFTQSYESNWRGDVAVTAESRRWWKSLLEYLAFEMMQGNPVTEFRVAISKSEVEEIFTKYLDAEKLDKPRDNAKCWLEDLLKHHLIQVGSGEKIEFRHQLLQEYYAAEYLLRQLSDINDDKLKRDYLNLLKWTEPVRLMLALVEDEKQALQVVKLGFNVDMMLGARLAGEVKPDFQKQSVDWILEQKLPKLLETELLDISRSHCAVDALINALNHEDSYVRYSAVGALGKIGSETAVDALINALNHQYYNLRSSAAYALGEIGSETAVDALINALNHEDSNVRKSAVSTLGKIGDERAVDALIKALNHEDYTVRFRTGYALGKIGSERAVDALINALNHQFSYVHSSVAYALGKIGSERAVDALIKALNHEDSDVRRSAAEALAKIGSQTAVEALIKALNHEDSDVRRSAAEALGEIGSQTAVDALINALNHEDSDVRRSAAEALAKIGSETAVDALINALNHEDFYVRWSAAEALGEIGSQTAVDALINALNHQFSYVRWSAADALGKIGSQTAVDALINALNHEDSDVRWRAAEALAKIGSETAVNPLIKALNHEDFYVRWRAADALGEIGSETVVDALINALNDEDSYIRLSAAEALGKIGSETAVDALINALNDENSDIRRSAASALGEIRSERAVDALINALSDEDSDVRREAAEALGKIRSETAVDALINALNDESSDVRRSAAEALENIAGSDKIAHIWKLLLNGTNEAKDIILKIQERCKFYNHEIFHSPLVEDNQKSDNLIPSQPQKILILAAIPHNLRLDREIRSIEECIRRAVRRDMFKVEIKTAVRSQDIRRAIAEEKPRVVHFCGHGLEDGSLLLEDDGGNDKPVKPSGLAALFQLHADYVKCVVLNACYSIKAAEAISKYINYAIGMNQPIQDTSAIEFAQGFYDGLGYDSQKQDMFQRAFQEGKIAIQLDNFSQAEIPVMKVKSINN